MNRIAPVLLGAVAATGATAQPGAAAPAMPCREIAALVAARGGIVLATGPFTYERVVRDRAACLTGQTTRPLWIIARDAPQCFAGFSCVEQTSRPR